MRAIALLLGALLMFGMACKKTETPAPASQAVAAAADPAKMEALLKCSELVRNSECAKALAAVDEAMARFGPDDFYGVKSWALHKNGQSEEGLQLCGQALDARKGNRLELLGIRYNILAALNRFDQALDAAKTMDAEDQTKRPWICLGIAEAHMGLNQPAEALSALVAAVDRGLIIKSNITENAAFKPLLETPDCKALLARMDRAIGLGVPAKAFAVKDIKDQPVSLESLKGKVVLIDFWATWCIPCRKEIPGLKACYSELKDKGFEIVGISLDQDRAALDKGLAELGIEWRIACSGKTIKDDETCILYGIKALPSTRLVDRKGVLRHSDLRGKELKEAIIALLDE